MTTTAPALFFDFTDPVSFLVARELDRARLTSAIEWIPLELRPPPTPLVAIDDPSLAERWALARAESTGTDIVFVPPRLVPWTRKAHELVAHVDELDRDTGDDDGLVHAIRSRIFEAYHLDGRDIGRVDVLVDLAVSLGLDRTGARAVLDVDRFEETVVAARLRAQATDVSSIPVIVRGERRLQGFHNGAGLRTFLGTSPAIIEAPNRTETH